MQTSNRLLDDLAKVASGAASTVIGIKDEIDGMVRQRFERLLTDLAVVTRDEFEAVRLMAVTARAEQEKLEKRLAELEAKGAAKRSRPSRAKKADKPAGSEPPKSSAGAGG